MQVSLGELGFPEVRLLDICPGHDNTRKIESESIFTLEGALAQIVKLVTSRIGLADGRARQCATILVRGIDGREFEGLSCACEKDEYESELDGRD